MRRVIVSSVALLVFGMVVVTLFMTTTASAPPPAPAPPPSAPATGHEGYPYAGIPPSGHEQAGMQNSYPTTQQQMLYSKFVGFYPDYAN